MSREVNRTFREAAREGWLPEGCSRAPRHARLDEMDRGGELSLDQSTGLLTLDWRYGRRVRYWTTRASRMLR